MRKLAVVLALAAVLVSGLLFNACLLGDFNVLPPDEGDAGTDAGEGGASKANGGSCASGPECSSGNCADGVCCDSACKGTCEKCSAAGLCVPIPDGQDPDKECPTKPLPPMPGDDAGAGGDAGDAGDEGGTDDGGWRCFLRSRPDRHPFPQDRGES